MLHDVPDDRNDGGDDVGPDGWSREWSSTMATLSGPEPVSSLFRRQRQLSQAREYLKSATLALIAANLYLDAARPTILTNWTIALAGWVMTLVCRRVDSERAAMRRDIRSRLTWEGGEE